VFAAEVQLATAIVRALLAACVLRHPKAAESFGEVASRGDRKA
jgi:hypothetical protein